MTRKTNMAKRIAQLIKDFIAEKTYSKTRATISCYISSLRQYAKYLKNVEHTTPANLSYESFAADPISRFLFWLMDVRHNKPQSINRRLSNLKAFVKYAAKNDTSFRTIYSGVKMLEPLRETKKAKGPALSKDAIAAILQATESCARPVRQKYHLLISLTYCTATREDEILSLRRRNVSLTSPKPYITVMGKGRKERSLPIPKDVAKEIKDYLRYIYGNNVHDDDLVFPSTVPNKQLSGQGVNQQLKRLAVIAHTICEQVPLQLHMHMFRHAKATHMLEDGQTIAVISTILGHESYDTTMTYLGISDDTKRKALNTLVPEQYRYEKSRYDIDDINAIFFKL